MTTNIDPEAPHADVEFVKAARKNAAKLLFENNHVMPFCMVMGDTSQGVIPIMRADTTVPLIRACCTIMKGRQAAIVFHGHSVSVKHDDEAHASAIQTWLDKNPGKELKDHPRAQEMITVMVESKFGRSISQIPIKTAGDGTTRYIQNIDDLAVTFDARDSEDYKTDLEFSNCIDFIPPEDTWYDEVKIQEAKDYIASIGGHIFNVTADEINLDRARKELDKRVLH